MSHFSGNLCSDRGLLLGFAPVFTQTPIKGIHPGLSVILIVKKREALAEVTTYPYIFRSPPPEAPPETAPHSVRPDHGASIFLMGSGFSIQTKARPANVANALSITLKRY